MYSASIDNNDDVFYSEHSEIREEDFHTSAGNRIKAYRERRGYRCITNNKRGITNMAVLIVSE